jgi:hypothetical protein
MCNAYNHPPGCACGFGPPYPFGIRGSIPEFWFKDFFWDESSFIQKLIDLGFDALERESMLRDYHENHYPIRRDRWNSYSIEEKRGFTSVIEKLFFTTRETESRIISHEVPLFFLHSPRVKGCQIRYAYTIELADKAVCSIKILGVGTGNSRSFKIVLQSEFCSKGGRYKLIFFPLRLRICTMEVSRKGKVIRNFIRAEADPDFSFEHTQIILRDLTKAEIESLMPEEKEYKEYDLRGDSSNDTVRYFQTISLGDDKKLMLDLKVFDQEIGVGMELSSGQGFDISADLMPGYLYRCNRCTGINGSVWKATKAKKEKQ